MQRHVAKIPQRLTLLMLPSGSFGCVILTCFWLILCRTLECFRVPHCFTLMFQTNNHYKTAACYAKGYNVLNDVECICERQLQSSEGSLLDSAFLELLYGIVTVCISQCYPLNES